jgi:uncharacterized protein (TIRG00374 family)
MFTASWSKNLLKLIGPFLFVFLLIWVIDPREAIVFIKEVDVKIALLSILLFPVILYAMTLQWWIICQRINLRTPLGKLFNITYISWFLSNLPMSGITFIFKIIYLKEEDIPTSRAFISVTLEKLFGVIGVLIFGIFPFFYFPTNFMNSTIVWITFGFIAFGICLGIVFKSRIINAIIGILNIRFIKHAFSTTENMESDLRKYWNEFDIRTVSLIVGISLGIGLLNSLVLYLLARAMEIQISFGFALGCTALIGLANIFPVTLNGLGTRDAILLLTFSLINYPGEAALALSCIAFFWTFVFKLSGVFFWLRRPVPYKVLSSIREKYFQA